MTALDTESVRPSGPEGSAPQASRLGRLGSVEVLAAVVVAVLLARGWLLGLLDTPRTLTLVTVFVSIMVQAMPFLILGTMLSAAITAFVPARFFERALPRRTAAAVPVAGMAGALCRRASADRCRSPQRWYAGASPPRPRSRSCSPPRRSIRWSSSRLRSRSLANLGWCWPASSRA